MVFFERQQVVKIPKAYTRHTCSQKKACICGNPCNRGKLHTTHLYAWSLFRFIHMSYIHERYAENSDTRIYVKASPLNPKSQTLCPKPPLNPKSQMLSPKPRAIASNHCPETTKTHNSQETHKESEPQSDSAKSLKASRRQSSKEAAPPPTRLRASRCLSWATLRNSIVPIVYKKPRCYFGGRQAGS